MSSLDPAGAYRAAPHDERAGRPDDERGVELAERAGKLLDERVPAIEKTSDLVQEITAEEMSGQAEQLQQAMSFFKVAEPTASSPAHSVKS